MGGHMDGWMYGWVDVWMGGCRMGGCNDAWISE